MKIFSAVLRPFSTISPNFTESPAGFVRFTQEAQSLHKFVNKIFYKELFTFSTEFSTAFHRFISNGFPRLYQFFTNPVTVFLHSGKQCFFLT